MDRDSSPTCNLDPSTLPVMTAPTGPLAACFSGSSAYQDAKALVEGLAKTYPPPLPTFQTKTSCMSSPYPLSQIRRFLISFLDMVAFIRQQYNSGNLSSSTCEGFIQAQGVQPSTCQCVLGQLCVRFLQGAYPFNPFDIGKALAYLLADVLHSTDAAIPTELVSSSQASDEGAPELLNHVLLLANVLQTPISWSTLQTCKLTTSDYCAILLYGSPGLLQASLADFSLCGTSGVPFSLSTITSIPERFISASSSGACGVACGEWLSEFQKDADNCQDYVSSLFNFDSPSKVASSICDGGGIFDTVGFDPVTKKPYDYRSVCRNAFEDRLNLLTSTAQACCTSSRSASRQKGLRWFLLGLGIVCAILLLVGTAGLFKKLSVLSKKATISTVYSAKASANQ